MNKNGRGSEGCHGTNSLCLSDYYFRSSDGAHTLDRIMLSLNKCATSAYDVCLHITT